MLFNTMKFLCCQDSSICNFFFRLFSFATLLSHFASCRFSASFHGDSFLFESLADYQSSTTISLQFQTQALNGIILLAAGQEDYLIISLSDGLIKVQVNVGSGEAVLISPAKKKYNDLLWHRVRVLKTDSLLSLRINDIDVASGTVPTVETDTSLDIDLGVFLGGYDYNVGASYLENTTPFFRGCILNAEYNSVDVLDPIYNVPGKKSVHNVNAGCSRIFRARNKEPLSFQTATAYLKFDRWSKTSEATFECSIKTTGQNGLLLFNTGWDLHEFIALEMAGGTIRASVNKGSGVIGLQTTRVVNDGKWHKIRFSFTPSVLEIRVDRNKTRIFVEQPDDTSSNELNLKGSLYVGGVDAQSRNEAKQSARGVTTSSFPGCIKIIRVNFKQKTVKDILASHAVSVGCSNIKPFDASAHQPDVHTNLPTFVIVPNQLQKRPKAASETNHQDTVLQQISDKAQRRICYGLHTRELRVSEGATTNITHATIGIQLVPYEKQRHVFNDNSQRAFRFTLQSVPRNGVLRENDVNLKSGDSFLAQNVVDRQIVYEHDGSDTTGDGFSFVVKSDGLSAEMKAMDAKKYRLCDTNLTTIENTTIFTLNISVAAVDDPPTLEIPQYFVFSPIRNARTPLPKDILQAMDPDSDPTEIVYQIIGISAGLYIEKNSSIGRPVHTFTQQDINEQLLYFVHAGGSDNSRLLLQISNHNTLVNHPNSAVTALMRIASISLKMEVSHNTGLTLVEGEARILTENLLSISSNAGTSLVDIRYIVVDAPLHGKVQVMQGDDAANTVWTIASTFKPDDIASGRVRYLNIDSVENQGTTFSDRFKFKLTGAGVESEVNVFNITVLRVVVSLSMSPLLLRGRESSVVFGTQHLSIDVTGLSNLSYGEVQIFVAKSLKHGTLQNSETGRTLEVASAFTWAQLRRGLLTLELNLNKIDPREKEVRDSMTLYALVRGRHRSPRVSFNLTYIPDATIIKITSNTLNLDEGEEVIVTPDLLSAETLLHRRFLFQIKQQPAHGTLALHAEADSQASRDSRVTSVTTRDIVDGRLHYKHDGGESTDDSFTFTVTPILDGELPDKISSLQNVSTDGAFNISISLVNDNAPVRVVNRDFNIARNTQRLLTRDDLWYHDPDIDQDDLDLVYVRRGLLGSDIVDSTNKRKSIFEFTQRDIINNRIVFKHRGNKNFQRFVFWVKDGKHFSTGLFVVSASAPYLKVANSTKLLVKKGGNVSVTPSNLQYETNVKGLKSLIQYSVIHGPEYGHFELVSDDTNNTTQEVTQFTQQDINDMRLVYVQDEAPGQSGGFYDSVDFTVTAGHVTEHGNLAINVYLASLQQPPVMKRNRLLVVDERSALAIHRSQMRATHSTVTPRDIVYIVTSAPEYGSLQVNRSGIMKTQAQEFSQWEINQGRVFYNQDRNVSFDDVDPADAFTYDVSNGILSLENVTTRVEIIPITIPLRSGNFSVDEGMSRVLVSDYVYIASQHFSDLELDVTVVTQPRHGRLESSRQADVALTRFSWRLVLAEFVFYVHDGSDTLEDSYDLRVQSVDGGKTSSVVTTHIKIIPVNDEAPYMVNNTGMTIWVNSVTSLSSHVLAAVDPDSPPTDLRYEILPPKNGHFAVKHQPQEQIINFTQAQINEGDIVFVHKGSNTGGMTFQVNDGLNFDTKHIFVITATPLVITVDPTLTLQVFPGTLTAVNTSNLHATTNDPSESRDVTYSVSRAPKYGAIVRKDDPDTSLSNFTQREVDGGAIFYKQDRQVGAWTSDDDVVLTASSYPADDVIDIEVAFNVSYEAYRVAGRSSSVQTNEGIKLSEGGSVNITTMNLDASNLLKKFEDPDRRKKFNIKYRIVGLPRHGTVVVNGKQAVINTTFIHAALNRSLVTYSHDGSEESQDEFIVDAFLVSKKNAVREMFSVRDTFRISVDPVNDNLPDLKTKSPNLKVVQGFVGTLMSSNLLAVDLDNPSRDIAYTIVRAPKYGKLRYVSGDRAPGSDVITRFTQNDVNQGRVAYVQNTPDDAIFPGDEVTSDAFYFSLTDGFHRPSYSLFRIVILPVELSFNTKPVNLLQGKFSALLHDRVINVTTNGQASLITFQVVKGPDGGALYMGNAEVVDFSNDALQAGNVSYLMNTRQSSFDNFTLMAIYNRSRGLSSINVTETIQVVVTPLITTGDLEVASEGKTSISLSSLNASELARNTRSMPVYDIIAAPQYATFILSSGQNISHQIQRRSLLEPALSFTHDDVSRGLVFLQAGHVNLTNRSHVDDSFTYRLGVADGSVQPAVSQLQFRIVARSDERDWEVQENTTSPPTNTTLGNTLPSTTTTTASTTLPTTSSSTVRVTLTSSPSTIATTTTLADAMEVKDADTSDYPWLIPLIVAIGVLLILIIAFIVFCCIRERKLGPAHVKGHETAVKSPPAARRKPAHRSDIDAHTHVTVTSRSDTIESSQRCPTADVVVTPLRGASRGDVDYDTDTGSYDDGYISNSVPQEGLLSAAGMANFSLMRAPAGVSASLQGFPEPRYSVDAVTRPMLAHEHGHLYASDDSILSDDEETEPFALRNVRGSVGSLPLPGTRGLSVAPAKVNQYWV